MGLLIFTSSYAPVKGEDDPDKDSNPELHALVTSKCTAGDKSSVDRST